MFSLDRHATTPLTEQVEQGLRALIEDGRLPPGARLMSIRQLGRQLGVSANTVLDEAAPRRDSPVAGDLVRYGHMP